MLVTVMVSKVLPPDTMEFGENTLAMLGGLIASSVSVVGLGLLPLLVTNAPAGMVFTKLPPAVARTSTLMMHVPGVPSAAAAGIAAPVFKVTVLALATAVTVPAVHVVLAFGVAAITRFVGNVSTKAAVSVAAVRLLLDTVIVSVLVPPTATVFGAANALTMVGAVAVLVLKVACAVLPVAVTGVPPKVVVPVGAAVTLVKVVFAVLMVTVPVTVHDAPAANAPPATLMVLPPVMLLVVHVPPKVCTAGRNTMPAGNVSVKP